MRRALAAAAALFLFATWAQADAGWDLVWRSEAASEQVSVEGEVRTMVQLGRRAERATAEVRAARGKMRFDYEADGRRWSLIDDGHDLIQLRPKQEEAVILARPTLVTDRELAERNYTARITGEVTVAGRRTRVVEITPRDGGTPAWRLWVDRETGLALKRERYNYTGDLTMATEYLSLRFGAPAPAELFTIPPGWTRKERDGAGARLSVEALSKRVGFEVAQPGYLPPGYVLVGGYLGHGRDGGPGMAELRYTDGLRLMSVFERPGGAEDESAAPEVGGGRGPRQGRGGMSPAVGGGRGRHRGGRGEGGGMGGGRRERRGFGAARGGMTITDRGGAKALRYSRDDRVVVVVGDLPEEELIRVAKSVAQ
jgi:outer membrane lipoprotein-sorting protein